MKWYGIFCLLALACPGAPCAAAPAPAGLAPRVAPLMYAGRDPGLWLSAFLGIPYREDGAINEQGAYVLFQNPAELPSPGLNCSGFVLEASRFLLRADIPLAEAVRDRMGDSGPDSALGKDWDFGWDLILNISEGHPRSLLLPGGKTADPTRLSGNVHGFDLHAAETWKELPARLRPGRLYLFSFNKPAPRKDSPWLHYHVGLAWVSPQGQIWYYHTTPKAKGVTRRDLATAEGRASFLRAFANTGKTRKMVAVVEVLLPDAVLPAGSRIP